MNNATLKKLIIKSRGVTEADKYFSFKLDDLQKLAETAREMMINVPPSFGDCALLSASWASFLQDQYSIPAIVIAGDLKIGGIRVFKCKKNLPEAGRTGKLVIGEWSGHCWIEIDGYIGDMSIFRTAYTLNSPNVLKDYIVSNFGYGKGVMLSPISMLPAGMKYIPKYVLNDNQINGLISGLSYKLEQLFSKDLRPTA